MSIHAECRLKIISGPHKGEIFQMVSNQVTVGRSKTNDICLTKDSKVSRSHIKIFLYKNQFWLEKIAPQNFLHLDGKKVTAHTLSNRSVISLGNTKIQFLMEVNKSVDESAPAQEEQKTVKAKQAFRTPLFVAAACLIIFALVGQDNTETRKPQMADVQTDIDKIEHITQLEAKLEDKAKKAKIEKFTSKQSTNAKQNEISGFRYYRQGHFLKALKAFEGCLSIDPLNNTCQIYQSMSERKIEQLIDYHIKNARQYYAQKQYNYCTSSLKNALSLMLSGKDVRQQEAMRQIQLCEVEKKIR